MKKHHGVAFEPHRNRAAPSPTEPLLVKRVVSQINLNLTKRYKRISQRGFKMLEQIMSRFPGISCAYVDATS